MIPLMNQTTSNSDPWSTSANGYYSKDVAPNIVYANRSQPNMVNGLAPWLRQATGSFNPAAPPTASAMPMASSSSQPWWAGQMAAQDTKNAELVAQRKAAELLKKQEAEAAAALAHQRELELMYAGPFVRGRERHVADGDGGDGGGDGDGE